MKKPTDVLSKTVLTKTFVATAIWKMVEKFLKFTKNPIFCKAANPCLKCKFMELDPTQLYGRFMYVQY